MTVPVDIFVKDDSVLPAPIVGAAVNIVDPVTLLPVAYAISDGNGKAAFNLPGSVTPGTSYEVRVFKLGVWFLNPLLVKVEDPPVTTNKFDVSGTILDLEVSVDPRCCRCSGRFVGLSNAPISNATVRIMAKAESGFQTPKVLDGNMVSADTLALRTDLDGYVVVDLIRGAEYYITFSGEDDTEWSFKVPDRASVNLIDLIHPFPVSLDWSDTDAPLDICSVAVGETKEIAFSVLFTDFQSRTKDTVRWLLLTNSDTLTMDVKSTDGKISITGRQAGTATVSVSQSTGVLPSVTPPYTVTGPDLTVTVTP